LNDKTKLLLLAVVFFIMAMIWWADESIHQPSTPPAADRG